MAVEKLLEVIQQQQALITQLMTDKGANIAPTVQSSAIQSYPITLQELWDRYELAFTGRENSIKAFRSQMRRFLDAEPSGRGWASRQVMGLTLEDLDLHRKARRGRPTRFGTPVRDSTYYTELATLRMVLRWGVSRKLIPNNPIADGLPTTVTTGIRKTTYDQQTVELIAGRSPNPLRAYVYAIADTGIRPAEFGAMQWGWIDQDTGWGVVPDWVAKNKKERYVRFSKRSLEAMRELGGKVWVVEDHDELGKPHQANGERAQRQWRRVVRALGIKGVDGERPDMYSLRHTAATDMIAAGVPPAHVAATLGHSIRMLERNYMKVTRSHIATAYDKLEQAREQLRAALRDAANKKVDSDD